ncbi:hypothetical protein [Microbacterium sp.]|uniref:hypothetical protein n=1 Tax=Microbacterium sp. TaxID=51671 RepID=UPI002812182E|nr:hypothetical protein [Microbacterium sp.]
MSQNDMLFIVLIAIGVSSLTIFIVQLVRSRRRGPGDGDGRAGWWEGPWDDDDRRR